MSLDKPGEPLTPEEEAALIKSLKRHAALFQSADIEDSHVVREVFCQLNSWLELGSPEAPPTDWGGRILGQLEDGIRNVWKVFFPGVVQGMTWEGSLAFQGAGCGELHRFPSLILLGNGDVKVKFKETRRDKWSVKILTKDATITAWIVFLKESEEKGRLHLSVDWEPIPSSLISSSDRFIILLPTESPMP